jgi:hypothetical protein
MQRYRILHRTSYNFSGIVQLRPHTLRLRPREDYELRNESSTLTITPPASLLWHRDVEGNAVAIATFDLPTNQLSVESEVVIHQYNETPLNFLVADYAINWPYIYQSGDTMLLSPYMAIQEKENRTLLNEWIGNCWLPKERIQTYTLLHRICTHIHQTLSYQQECPNPRRRYPGHSLVPRVRVWMWACGERHAESCTSRNRPIMDSACYSRMSNCQN